MPISSQDVSDPQAALYSRLSFGQVVRRVGGSTSIYTIGLVAVNLGNFLLIPIYWRYLTPDDYGVLAIASIVTTFVAVVLGFNLDASVTRFYHSWRPEERQKRLGAIWILHWGSSLVIGGAVALGGEVPLETIITKVSFDPVLRLAIWSTVFGSFSLIPLMTLRVMEQAWTYVLCAAMTFVLQTGLAIILVVGLKKGVIGVLQSQLIANAVMTLLYIPIMRARAQPNFKIRYWREALVFSMPLTPASLIESVATVSDRFLLEKYVSLNSLGLYSVADSLGQAVTVTTRGLKTAWIPFEMRVINERPQDGPLVIGRMLPYFVLVLLGAVTGLVATGHDLILVIGVEKYRQVIHLLPFATLPYLAVGIGTFVGQGYSIARKTRYAWMRTTTQLVVAVVGNLLLVPRWGVYGAFASTTASAASGWMVAYLLSQHFFPIPFEWKKIGIMAAGSIVTILVSYALPLPVPIWGLLVRTSLVFFYMGCMVLFVLGGFPLVKRFWMRAL